MTQDVPENADTKSDPVARVASGLRAGLPQSLLLAQRVRPAPGQPRPYEPHTPILAESAAAAHLAALKDIAQARFAFPTDRYRDFKTYTNVPQRSMGVAMSNGDVAYPHIVVVQSPENYAKVLGEVATAETVAEGVARFRWLPFAKLAPLYLYIPVGQGDLARKLCRDLNVPIVGIRTWRYSVGTKQIEISDYYTAP